MIYVHVEVVRSIKTVVEEKYKKVPFGHFFKTIDSLNKLEQDRVIIW